MVRSNKDKKKVIHGRWNKITITKQKRIKATYHKIKDWRMDPKGYFLINVDRKNKKLRVGYCEIKKINGKPSHEMAAEVFGDTALEIINTLIRKNFLSTLQHAGDMGIELYKAELALKYNLKYIQDKDLNLK